MEFDALGEAQSPPVRWYPREDLSIYTGTYFDNWNVGENSIESNESHLTVNIPRLDEYGVNYDPIWQPYSVDTFLTTIDGNNILIGFVEGKWVIQYITHRAFVAHRSAEAPPPLPHPPDLSNAPHSTASTPAEPDLQRSIVLLRIVSLIGCRSEKRLPLVFFALLNFLMNRIIGCGFKRKLLRLFERPLLAMDSLKLVEQPNSSHQRQPQ